MTRPRRADLRLAVPAVGAWAAAALVQDEPVRRGVAIAVVAAVAGLASLALFGLDARVRRRTVRVVAGAGLGVACGAAAMTVHLAALHRGPVAAYAATGDTVELRLRLVRDPAQVHARTGRTLTVVNATATAVRRNPAGGAAGWQPDRAPVTVFAIAGHWLGLLPGQQATVEARLRRPRPGDLVTAVAFVSADPVLVGRPPLLQRWAGRVRDGLRDACSSLGADERGLLPGLVLGDVAAMPPNLTVAFRLTGLTHLCAVSGANCAIVVGAVLAALQRAGASRRWRAMLAAMTLPAFVVLVRPSPSVLRAALMGALVLLADVIGRRSATVPVLSATVLGLVVVDPFLARSPGFAMSVAATAAIVLVAPRWTARLARVLPRPLAAAVAVPAAAQLACTPILMAAFGQLTPLAIPANLLAAPAVAPATLLGVTCALVGLVSGSAAGLIARLAGLAAGWLAVVARTLAAAPGSGLRGPTGVAGAAWAVGCCGAVWLVASVVRRRRARAMLDPCPP